MNKQDKVFFKFIKFSYSTYKPYYFVVILNAIFTTIYTIFNVYSLSLLIKALENDVYNEALKIGLIIVLVNLILNFLAKLMKRIEDISQLKMKEAINQRITTKLMKIPFHYLEDPYYLDLKERAKFSVENQNTISRFLNAVAELIQIVITLIGIVAILITFDILLIGILIIAVILNVLAIAFSLKTQMNFYNELIPINRRFSYYLETLHNEVNAKDYRMYSVGNLMANKFQYYAEETVTYFGKLARKIALITSLGEIVKYLEMALVYGYVAIKTIVKGLPVSSFSLYISSALSFSRTMSRLIEVILTFMQTVTYLKPFIELIALEEDEVSGNIKFDGRIKEIEFKNISFAYPKSKQLVLDNISFKINTGEKISIVGLNGAGKTSLVKLLCRLYLPTSGDILVNGISIYDYDYNSYINEIAAVFQDYKLFAYSMKENILNNDASSLDAYEVVKKVGLLDKIESLPNKIDTLYSKVYDENGVELSGGERQKLAIARALYKDASLVILDEPTSALDPLAEADIYQNFNELVLDKTALYISHRMSSSVFCDKVLVIEAGKVIDFDTHPNLLKKKNSLYYKLFTSQARNYSK